MHIEDKVSDSVLAPVGRLGSRLGGKKNLVPYIVNILLAAVVFIMMYGIRVLDVTNDSWLSGMEEGSDLTQHYFGWIAYRNSDWAFPLGMGYGLNGSEPFSVLYTDSIPLVALFFKLIRWALPETFQYFGLYGFATFLLMAFFVTKILSRYNINGFYLYLVSLLVSFNSIMLWKMYFQTGLASHWLLLWAIDIVLSQRDKGDGVSKGIVVRMLCFGFIAVSIHSYLFLLCGLILGTFFIYEAIKRRSLVAPVVYGLSYCGTGIFALWFWGGFSATQMKNGSIEACGYNLNSFYNPMKWGNLILPKYPTIGIQQELDSYMYLGAGVLLMVVITAVLCVIGIKKGTYKLNVPLLVSVIIVSLIALFLAASPQISLNDKVVFQYEVPDFLYDAWAIFRTAARIAWVVYYFILIFGFIDLYRLTPQKYRSVVIALIFAIQLVDMSPIYLSVRYTLEHDMASQYVLDDNPVWTYIEEDPSLDEFVFFSADYPDNPVTVFPITEYALHHDMIVNQFYFARYAYNDGKDAEAIEILRSRDESCVYVFRYEELELPQVADAIEDTGLTLYETSGFVLGLFR